MGRTYEHTFADLHTGGDDPQPSTVDLEADGAVDQTGAKVKINPAPGNPDAGKTDQFGDLPSQRSIRGADQVDDGIDLDLDLTDTGQGEDVDDVVPTQDDADDDLKGLSKSQRERIMRERRLRQEAEERSRRVEAELAQVNRKVDLQAQEGKWSQDDEKDAKELGTLKDQKVKALEEGKTTEVVDLDDKITDIKARQRQREAERTAAREAAKKPVPQQPNPRAQAWIAKHDQYNTDPLFREAANAADRLLYSQGFSANTDEYYVRLSRILNEGGKFKIDPSYLRGAKQPRNGPRGTGSDGMQRTNNGDVRRQNNGRMTVTITAADKALLASMGQDPDDPNVLKAFAKEKLSQQRADEAARRDR